MRDLIELCAGTIAGQCPAHADWVAFAGGNISEELLEAMGKHLECCDQCLSEIHTLKEVDNKAQNLRRSLKEHIELPFTENLAYVTMERQIKDLLETPRLDLGLNTLESAEEAAPVFLGQYQILEKLGRGGMGVVYRATHRRLKKDVALKTLNAAFIQGDQDVPRFQREMEAVGRLNHDNIVRATDAGEAAGVHFLVMELVDGIDLSKLVAAKGTLRVADACDIVRQAAIGLQHVHDNGLVHRDIKPSNLMISSSGSVKILDLGLAALARQGDSEREITLSNQILGTMDYMAPEQWLDSRASNIQSDIYSLGCTLYKLLSGKTPFAGDYFQTMQQKRDGHCNQSLTALSDTREDVPAALSSVVSRMLCKSPVDRFPVPRDVAEALQPYCTGADLTSLCRAACSDPDSAITTPLVSPRVNDEIVPRSISRRRHRRLTFVCFAVLIAAVTSGTLAVVNRTQNPETDPNPIASALAPNRWHDLLQKPPTVFFDENPKNQSHWYYTQDRRIVVNAFRLQMLTLGRADVSNYKVAVGFEQTSWAGRFGVFFGGKRGGTPDKSVLSYQFVWLEPGEGSTNKWLNLQRCASTLNLELQGEPQIVVQKFVQERVTRRLGHGEYNNGECRLDIEVADRRPGGLSAVSLNGALYPSLTSQDVNKRFDSTAYQGEFGVFFFNSSATVTSASFQVYQ